MISYEHCESLLINYMKWGGIMMQPLNMWINDHKALSKSCLEGDQCNYDKDSLIIKFKNHHASTFIIIIINLAIKRTIFCPLRHRSPPRAVHQSRAEWAIWGSLISKSSLAIWISWPQIWSHFWMSRSWTPLHHWPLRGISVQPTQLNQMTNSSGFCHSRR